MDVYHLSLFVHLLALLGAAAASSLTHFAEGRVHRATSVREAQQWHALAGRSARTFPLVMLLLLATGGIMLWQGGVWSMRTGWVATGVVGIVLLFLTGGVLGRHAGALARELARQDAERGAETTPVIAPDAVAARLGWANTGIALAVTLVMVTKPALPLSLALLAAGAVLGAAMARVPQESAARDAMEESLAA